MVSKRYDLEKVLSKIIDSPKVRFMRQSDKRLLETQYGYINDYGKHYLKFVFIPTKDEYLEFSRRKEYKLNETSKFDYILDEVLGLSEFKKQ